jgi:hypothetical protein
VTTTLSSTLLRPISAKIAVDPITIPIARGLPNASATTPNKATALAGLLALGAFGASLRDAMDSETGHVS